MTANGRKALIWTAVGVGALGVVMFAMGVVRLVEQSQPDYELYRAGRAIGVFGLSRFEMIDNMLRGVGAAAFVAGVILVIIAALQDVKAPTPSPAPTYWSQPRGYLPPPPPPPAQWPAQQQWAPPPAYPPQQR